MSKLTIPTAEVFAPLLEPARYKGAHGGRGSGKSQFFAGLMIEDAVRFPGDAGEGLRGICAREVQKSLKESAKFLIEKKLQDFGLGEAQGFKVFNDVIQTPGDGLLVFNGLQDHTADSIKSFEGFHRFWAEEAQSISHRSVTLVRPTIRWENVNLGMTSELWWSWNPRRKTDAVDMLLRGAVTPSGSVIVQSNWRDNPWFPSVLEQERIDCLENEPGKYAHVWDGDYETVSEGAYFAGPLLKAQTENRICRVAVDPLMEVRAYWDLGGTGLKSDATAIWIAQTVGRELRAVDYYEAQGQPLASHVNWLREKGYGRAMCILPHDARQGDKVYSTTYEGALRDAGFDVYTVKNQGKGAARARIEAAWRVFPNIYFDAGKTEGGRDALGWYHKKIDETRGIDLGPEHDWSSHAADAFGLMCLAYEMGLDGWTDGDEWDDNAERFNFRNATTGY